MLTVENLTGLTDAVTISRGRVYARRGRVDLLPPQRARSARVFAGKRDVLEFDVNKHAVLGPHRVAKYRTRLEKSAATGPDTIAVRYSRAQIAVLDRDPNTIVTVIGRRPGHRVPRTERRTGPRRCRPCPASQSGKPPAASPRCTPPTPAASFIGVDVAAAARGDTDAYLSLLAELHRRRPVPTPRRTATCRRVLRHTSPDPRTVCLRRSMGQRTVSDRTSRRKPMSPSSEHSPEAGDCCDAPHSR